MLIVMPTMLIIMLFHNIGGGRRFTMMMIDEKIDSTRHRHVPALTDMFLPSPNPHRVKQKPPKVDPTTSSPR